MNKDDKDKILRSLDKMKFDKIKFTKEKMSIPMIITKENGWFIAKTPLIKDLCSQGETEADAIDELKGMIIDHIEDKDMKYQSKSPNFNIKYDPEVDILMIKPTEREYDSSIQDGNLVLDMDKKGNPVGLEMLDASKMFNKTKSRLTKFFGENKIVYDKHEKNPTWNKLTETASIFRRSKR